MYLLWYEFSRTKKYQRNKSEISTYDIVSASVSTDKSNLVKTPLPTITDHVQVQNTANPTIYTVPVSNIALNQQ